TLNLGKGDDRVNLNLSQKISAPKLAININGGPGAQSVQATFGAISGTDLRLAARLGDGYLEQFSAKLNGEISGKATVDLNIKGGKGIDGINVQANGAITAPAKLSVEAALA